MTVTWSISVLGSNFQSPSMTLLMMPPSDSGEMMMMITDMHDIMMTWRHDYNYDDSHYDNYEHSHDDSHDDSHNVQ